MTDTAAQRAWLQDASTEDLSDIHHACRMLVQYPGISAAEADRYRNLADSAWAEIGRRAT